MRRWFWLLLVCSLWVGLRAQDAPKTPAPTLTADQKKDLTIALQRLQIAQQQVQLAQRAAEDATEAAQKLYQSLQVPGYTLDPQTMTYAPVAREDASASPPKK